MEDSNAPGLRVHKVNDFTSFSAGMDLRILGTPWKEGFALHYVDHHDKAYQWARNHSMISDESTSLLEFLPLTDNTIIRDNEASDAASIAYGTTITARLRDYKIPEVLAKRIEAVDSEDALLDLIQCLSPCLQEIILNAATGQSANDIPATGSSRVVVINDDDELVKALEYPLDNWRLFLHPVQKDIVDEDWHRKIVIVGGPGTGKTIVLVHRAIKLSKEGRNVILVTKTKELAELLLTLIGKKTDQHTVKVGYLIKAGKPNLWASSTGTAVLQKKCGPPYKIILTQSDTLARLATIKDEALSLFNIDHLFLDETHDLCGENDSQWIRDFFSKQDIGITLSIDFNQSVYQSVPIGIATFFHEAPFRRAILSYSYRSTREIIKYASKLSKEARRAACQNMELNVSKAIKKGISRQVLEAVDSHSNYPVFYGLTGEPVEVKKLRQAELLEELKKTVDELKEKFGASEIAIIENFGKSETVYGKYFKDIEVQTSKKAKGLEWFAGVVITTGKDLATSNMLSANSLYVALTRFREKVVVFSLSVDEISSPNKKGKTVFYPISECE